MKIGHLAKGSVVVVRGVHRGRLAVVAVGLADARTRRAHSAMAKDHVWVMKGRVFTLRVYTCGQQAASHELFFFCLQGARAEKENVNVHQQNLHRLEVPELVDSQSCFKL